MWTARKMFYRRRTKSLLFFQNSMTTRTQYVSAGPQHRGNTSAMTDIIYLKNIFLKLNSINFPNEYVQNVLATLRKIFGYQKEKSDHKKYFLINDTGRQTSCGRRFICSRKRLETAKLDSKKLKNILICSTTRCSKRHVTLSAHNMDAAYWSTRLYATSTLASHIFCRLMDDEKNIFPSTHKISTIFSKLNDDTSSTRLGGAATSRQHKHNRLRGTWRTITTWAKSHVWRTKKIVT